MAEENAAAGGRSHCCSYDLRRDRRVDRVPEGAQLSHSVGNPMSQQTNAGFNAPRFSVGTSDKDASRPSICMTGSSCFLFGFPRNADRSLSFFRGAQGVAHNAACATFWSVTVAFDPSGRLPVALVPSGFVCPPEGVVGVGHSDEPQPVSPVRRADAASWQYGRPAGVAFAFQVSETSVEPPVANRVRNLLSKYDCRPALADERGPYGPEVALVGVAFAFASDAVGLAWA